MQLQGVVNNERRNNPFNRTYSYPGWRHTGLAAQPQLGLWTQWRGGYHRGDTAGPGAIGSGLAKKPGTVTSAGCPCCPGD